MMNSKYIYNSSKPNHTTCMSQTKPQIGRKLKYKYEDKWYKAEIISVSMDTITIKVWKSILKPKIVYVAKHEWKQVISSTKNVFDGIFLFDDNIIFPEWVRISQIVLLHDENFISPKSPPQLAKIIHYKDGNYITIQYIKYTQSKQLQLITQTIKYIQTQIETQIHVNNIAMKCGDNKILFPYYNAFENDKYFDITFSNICDVINSKTKKLKEINGFNLDGFRNNKFNIYINTKDNEGTFMDGLCSFIRRDGTMSYEQFKRTKLILIQEEYDSDAIQCDIEYNEEKNNTQCSNIYYYDDDYYDLIRRYIYHIKLHQHTFAVGYRFYY
eukprot:130076_1